MSFNLNLNNINFNKNNIKFGNSSNFQSSSFSLNGFTDFKNVSVKDGIGTSDYEVEEYDLSIDTIKGMTPEQLTEQILSGDMPIGIDSQEEFYKYIDEAIKELENEDAEWAERYNKFLNEARYVNSPKEEFELDYNFYYDEFTKTKVLKDLYFYDGFPCSPGQIRAFDHDDYWYSEYSEFGMDCYLKNNKDKYGYTSSMDFSIKTAADPNASKKHTEFLQDYDNFITGEYTEKFDLACATYTGYTYTYIYEHRKQIQEAIFQLKTAKYGLWQLYKEVPYLEIANSSEYKKYWEEHDSSNLSKVEFFGDKVEYLDDDELKMYHYLNNIIDYNAASDYLDAIGDRLNQRKGEKEANEFIKKIQSAEDVDLLDLLTLITPGASILNPDAYKNVYNSFCVFGKGIVDGLDNFANGIVEVFDNEGEISADQYAQMYVLQALSAEDSNTKGHLYNIGMAIGNMTVPMLVSFLGNMLAPGVGSAFGFALQGMSSYGNVKNQSLVNGETLASSRCYALFSSLSEVALSKVLGNIPGLNSSASLSLKGLFQEGLEEFLQEYVDAGYRAMAMKENIDLGSLAKDSALSFLYGMIVSGTMNGFTEIISFSIDDKVVSVDSMEGLLELYNDVKYGKIRLDSNGEVDTRNIKAFEAKTNNDVSNMNSNTDFSISDFDSSNYMNNFDSSYNTPILSDSDSKAVCDNIMTELGKSAGRRTLLLYSKFGQDSHIDSEYKSMLNGISKEYINNYLDINKLHIGTQFFGGKIDGQSNPSGNFNSPWFSNPGSLDTLNNSSNLTGVSNVKTKNGFANPGDLETTVLHEYVGLDSNLKSTNTTVVSESVNVPQYNSTGYNIDLNSIGTSNDLILRMFEKWSTEGYKEDIKDAEKILLILKKGDVSRTQDALYDYDDFGSMDNVNDLPSGMTVASMLTDRLKFPVTEASAHSTARMGSMSEYSYRYRISVNNSSNVTFSEIVLFVEKFNELSIQKNLPFNIKVEAGTRDVFICYCDDTNIVQYTQILNDMSDPNKVGEEISDITKKFGEKKTFTSSIGTDSYFGISAGKFVLKNNFRGTMYKGNTMTEYSGLLADRAYATLLNKYSNDFSKITTEEFYLEMHKEHARIQFPDLIIDSNIPNDLLNIPFWMDKQMYFDFLNGVKFNSNTSASSFGYVGSQIMDNKLSGRINPAEVARTYFHVPGNLETTTSYQYNGPRLSDFDSKMICDNIMDKLGKLTGRRMLLLYSKFGQDSNIPSEYKAMLKGVSKEYIDSYLEIDNPNIDTQFFGGDNTLKSAGDLETTVLHEYSGLNNNSVDISNEIITSNVDLVKTIDSAMKKFEYSEIEAKTYLELRDYISGLSISELKNVIDSYDLSNLSDAQLRGLADGVSSFLMPIVSKFYKSASSFAMEQGTDFDTYCDHTIGHVEEVAYKALESKRAIDELIDCDAALKYGKTSIFEIIIAGLCHDTGMMNEGAVSAKLDKDEIGNLAINTTMVSYDDTGNATRKNHSLNSALNALKLSKKLIELGVDPNIIALLCISHSKSCSGISSLTQDIQWSVAIDQISKAIEQYNSKNAEKIVFADGSSTFIESLIKSGILLSDKSLQKIYRIENKILANSNCYFFNDGLLKMLSSGGAEIRLGDANAQKGKLNDGVISQRGGIVFYELSSAKVKEESLRLDFDDIDNIKEFAIAETANMNVSIKAYGSDEIVSYKKGEADLGKAFIIGEDNISIRNLTKEINGNKYLIEEFKVGDALQSPYSTLFAINERLGELNTISSLNKRVEIILDASVSDIVYQFYTNWSMQTSDEVGYKIIVIRK